MYVKVEDEELLRRLSGRWICRQCQTPFHMVSSPPKVEGKCDNCGGELYQRADDTRETAQKRLGVFVSQTAPLIDYYQKQSKLVEINGQQSIEEVSKQLIAVLR
jgi:adenylate kinase